MAAVALKKKVKMFQATMLVTRMEEWCVEAESPEQAQALLSGGYGHRCHLGDCVQVEVQRVDTDA